MEEKTVSVSCCIFSVTLVNLWLANSVEPIGDPTILIPVETSPIFRRASAFLRLSFASFGR
eukprot:15355470-Ditylum_brightwellii.AAC.1